MENSIGRFKLPYSLSIPIHQLPKWVDERNTKDVESLIGQLFTKYLRESEKRKVLYFSHNEKDNNKNPDLFIHLDGNVVGIQVTQIVLNDYLSKFNQAKNVCEFISQQIREIYQPEIKINIQIFTPFAESDVVPGASKKIFKSLAKIIAEGIENNIDILKGENKYLNFNITDSKIKAVAGHYNLYPVPGTHHSNFFGEQNVYIDYGFDNVFISQHDIKNSVDKIYNDKNGGNSEILIIWGDERQFMGIEYELLMSLKEKFEGNTTFQSVYFITFANILEIADRLIFVDKIV